jgi:hypothetical protein
MPFQEHDPKIHYESPSSIPIISSILHVAPFKLIRVKCRREGDASDVCVTGDIAFDVFIDRVWVAACALQSCDSAPCVRSKPMVQFPSHLTS